MGLLLTALFSYVYIPTILCNCYFVGAVASRYLRRRTNLQHLRVQVGLRIERGIPKGPKYCAYIVERVGIASMSWASIPQHTYAGPCGNVLEI